MIKMKEKKSAPNQNFPIMGAGRKSLKEAALDIARVYNRTGKKGRLPSFLRENRPAQIFICVLMGALVGAITGLLHEFVSLCHRFAFMLGPEDHLSAVEHIDARLLFAVPALGGLFLGYVNREMKRRRSNDIVDPIEANAIYGGRMSVIDSLRLLAATLISNASGISVGMEAAYTQVGACCLSWTGQRLQLRREDRRIFVAAGAAAAISAAYNAPLAGAFYGYELVLGTYTIAALPQVTLCALTAALILRLFTAGNPIFSLPIPNFNVSVGDYVACLAVGVVAAGVSIVTMKAVTRCEHMFRRLPFPEWARPAIGGLIVGALAYGLSAQVMGSGQGGIDSHLHSDWSLRLLVILLVGKMLASAISIGSGFRGGLFSASLFLGCILGQICGLVAQQYMDVSKTGLETFMLAGTGSVAAAIIGAPMTMTFLVLEMTGSFPAMTAVLAGVLVASTVTRYSFGYSFSTWRFHLKGLGIKGAVDIGWIHELSMEKLMVPAAPTASVETSIDELRRQFPAAGSVRNVFLTDNKGVYHGVVSVADLHNPAGDVPDSEPGIAIAKGVGFFLLPDQDIKAALKMFAEARIEELPIVANAKTRKLVGYVREAVLLKRYSQEMESRQLAQTGT